VWACVLQLWVILRCPYVANSRHPYNLRTISMAYPTQKLSSVFYVHVTVHRSQFHFNRNNGNTNFSTLVFVKKLHIPGNSSAHHQEFSTVHSAVVYVMKFWWEFQTLSGYFVVTYHEVTGIKTTVSVKFRIREGPYFCVGASCLITADHPWPL